ncbi:MAG: hypothetical protein AABY84_13005 [Candidatus Firestonebacteria bacterium]
MDLKDFLTSSQTYAYDRYKSSLEFCGLKNKENNNLTDKGESFLNFILEYNEWKDIYNYIKKRFYNIKKYNKENRCNFNLNSKIKKEIERIIISLKYRRDKLSPPSKHIKDIYGQLKLKAEPFKDDKFPDVIKKIKSIEIRDTLKKMKYFYEIVKPILLIVNNIKKLKNKNGSVSISEIFDNGELTKLFKKEKTNKEYIKKLKEDYRDIIKFIENIHKCKKEGGKTKEENILKEIRERIIQKKGMVPYKIEDKKIKLMSDFKKKYGDSEKNDVSKFRFDVLYKIKKEINTKK